MFESYEDILTVPELAEVLRIGTTQASVPNYEQFKNTLSSQS